MGILAWLIGEEPDPITQIVNYENKGQFGEYLTNFALSKVKDYNQIMQNRTHINALARVTGISKNKFFSFIIFSRRCELKKVPAKTSEFEIMKRGLLIRRLNEIATSNERPDIFSNEQIDNIANLIRPFTNVSNEVKQKHIEDIKNIKPT